MKNIIRFICILILLFSFSYSFAEENDIEDNDDLGMTRNDIIVKFGKPSSEITDKKIAGIFSSLLVYKEDEVDDCVVVYFISGGRASAIAEIYYYDNGDKSGIDSDMNDSVKELAGSGYKKAEDIDSADKDDALYKGPGGFVYLDIEKLDNSAGYVLSVIYSVTKDEIDDAASILKTIDEQYKPAEDQDSGDNDYNNESDEPAEEE